MVTFLGVVGFLLAVYIFHRARIAMVNVAARGIDNAIASAKDRRPTKWYIMPGRLSAQDLQGALIEGFTGRSTGGTTFQVASVAGSQGVACTTQPGADLPRIQTEVLKVARGADERSQLRL